VQPTDETIRSVETAFVVLIALGWVQRYSPTFLSATHRRGVHPRRNSSPTLRYYFGVSLVDGDTRDFHLYLAKV